MSERREQGDRGQRGERRGRGHASVAVTVDRPAAEVAVAMARLRCLGHTVAQVGAACGLAPDQLERAEARESLEFTGRLPVEQLSAPAFAPLEDWCALLGDDLTLQLSVVGLDPQEPPIAAVVQADPDPRAAFDQFRERAQRVAMTQGDDVSIDLRVSVSKRRARAAAATIVGSRPEYLGSSEMAAATRLVVYYQTGAWNAALSLRGLVAWETQDLLPLDGRLTVVLCDGAGYLAGLALDVIGAGSRDVPEWLSVSRAAWRQFLDRARATRRLRDEEGSWPSAPRTLTPEYLHVAPRASGLEAVSAGLAVVRAELAAAYLASAVQGDLDDGLALRFAGPRPSSCLLLADPPDRAPVSLASGVIARLAAWAYRDASSEKLSIARECLARELPAGMEVSLAQVDQAAVPALEASKANLVLYLRRNVEQYFKVRQAAQDAVASYGETVRKAVGDLTGDVVDNLYRTIGVLAGVLVAGLVQPAASLGVLRLASVLYAVYIGFVLGVPLRARHDRFHLEQAALSARLGAMSELTEAERARLSAPARSAEAHFRHYFAVAAGIYGALGLVSLLLFILLWTPLASSLTLPHVGR
jgi:hypothetical protein